MDIRYWGSRKFWHHHSEFSCHAILDLYTPQLQKFGCSFTGPV